MTYYGRWTYKYEMGEKKGAAGVLIVHETEPAGYPFAVVQGKVAEQFDLESKDGNASRAAVEGWISAAQAKALFAMAGQDFDALKKKAVSRAFAPVPLGVTASVVLENTIRRVPSANVVAKLEGRDPAVRDEYVVYTTPLGPLRHRRRRSTATTSTTARSTTRAAPPASSRSRAPSRRARGRGARSSSSSSPARSRASSAPRTTRRTRSTRSRRRSPT